MRTIGSRKICDTNDEDAPALDGSLSIRMFMRHLEPVPVKLTVNRLAR